MSAGDDNRDCAEAKTAKGAPPSGRALCFSPHPDDEVIGAGGTLYLHRRQGDPVRVVVATDGVAGDPEKRFDPDPETYGQRRQQESRRGLAVLGIDDLVFWGLPDSCVVLETDLVELENLVAGQVVGFEPEVVYLPWEQDGNPDHLALHKGVVRGLRQASYGGLAYGYEVWSPNPGPELVVDITDVADLKRQAILCHETQLAYSDLLHQVFGLSGYRSLLLERSGGYGEAFARIQL